MALSELEKRKLQELHEEFRRDGIEGKFEDDPAFTPPNSRIPAPEDIYLIDGSDYRGFGGTSLFEAYRDYWQRKRQQGSP